MADESLPLPCYVLLDAIDEAGIDGLPLADLRKDARYVWEAFRFCRARRLIQIGEYVTTGPDPSGEPCYEIIRDAPVVVLLSNKGEAVLSEWRLRTEPAAPEATNLDKVREAWQHDLLLRTEPAAPEATNPKPAAGAAMGQGGEQPQPTAPRCAQP
jgi:hypothetical protein